MKKEQYQVEQKFYDSWTHKFLHDFLFANKRQEAAVEYVLSVLLNYPESKEILDFGCGLGSNSFLLSQGMACKVTALDLSEDLVSLGKSLFETRGECEFFNGSIESLIDIEENEDRFDSIVLLDVIEHIRWDDWPSLFSQLNTLLKPTGCIVITTPTSEHQKWLTDYKPSGLQPVDLFIEKEDIEKHAETIGFSVLDYRRTSPFGASSHGDNYQYFVISKDSKELVVDNETVGVLTPTWKRHWIVMRKNPNYYFRNIGIRSFFSQIKQGFLK